MDMLRKNSNSSAGSGNLSKNNNPGISLAIRSELFEHGIFPLQTHHGKITSTILIDTFTNLNLLSSIDYKIKL